MVRLHRYAMMATALGWKAFSFSFTSFKGISHFATRIRVCTPNSIGCFYSKRNCRVNNRGGVASLCSSADLIGAGTFLASLHGLADATTSAITSQDSIQGAADAIQTVNTAGNVITQHGGGWFGWMVSITEGSIIGIAEAFHEFGVPGAYGVAITALTVFGLTFPLTYQQLNLSNKLQAMQSKVKEIQNSQGENDYEKSKAIADLYSKSGVNPLAGFIPALVQIPIFIAFYRALMALAKDGRINEPFLWLPSLDGPTFGAPPTETLRWIKEWHAGVPLLGWHDTLCYLSLPVLLVISQYFSQQLMQPTHKANESSEKNSQAALKLIPFVIGWFSLNIPAGLGLYWIVNNVITTLTSVFIRGQIAGGSELGCCEPLYNEAESLFSAPPLAETSSDDGGD